MKILILIFIIILMSNQMDAQNLNKLKVGVDFKPTKYKPGFKYITNHGENATLLEYVKSHREMGLDIYRWRERIEKLGVSAIVWTDDCWIDVSTGKAYLDECQHKIVYYNNYSKKQERQK